MVSIGLFVLRVGAAFMLAFPAWKLLFQAGFKTSAYPQPFVMNPTLGMLLFLGVAIVCTLFLAIGLLSRLASAGILAYLVVQVWDAPFLAWAGVFNPAMGLSVGFGNIALSFLVIILTGPGRISFDRILFSGFYVMPPPAPQMVPGYAPPGAAPWGAPPVTPAYMPGYAPPPPLYSPPAPPPSPSPYAPPAYSSPPSPAPSYAPPAPPAAAVPTPPPSPAPLPPPAPPPGVA